MKTLMLAAAAAALFAAPAADPRDFQLVNGTGRAIAELYISPANVNDWEEDLLSVDMLGDGDTTNISFEADDRDECIYDLKIVHKGGDNAVWQDLNLCAISWVSLQYQDDGTPIAQFQ